MTVITRRDWPLALRGLLRLGRDHGDLAAVMDITQGLEGRSIWTAYRRMNRSAVGRRLMIERAELSDRLMDTTWLARFPAGSFGAAYRGFIAGRTFSARTLADQLIAGPNGAVIRRGGPVPWFARRIADLHDVAHVLTGYETDPQGEGCVMAWTFGQLGAFGYAAIALGSAFIFSPAAAFEAWRAGRRAGWIFDLDVEAAFAEPLDQVRDRLNIAPPRLYRQRRSFA